jgi:hypothetical protein
MRNLSFAHDRSATEPEFGASEISPAMAAELLLKRRRIRRSLIEWSRYCGYEPALHHKLLIDRLERVARGEIKRLAVFMPPGSAKSTYGSILFPPYVMANSPSRALLAASHTTELAEKWGRRVRNLIAAHGGTLGIRLSADNHAAGRWELVTGRNIMPPASAPPLPAFAPTARLSMTPSARVRTPIPNMCATKSGTGTNRTS